MPSPLTAALKLIPWRDVVLATPAIVRGARELWSRTKKRRLKASAPTGTALGTTKLSAEERLAQLESRLDQLAEEQFAANELLNTLAEQNAGLIEQVQGLRTRSRALTGACVLLALAVLAVWLR